MVFTKKATIAIIGLALLPLVAVEAVFINSNFVIAKPTKASEHRTTLNKDNVPSISAGEGSMVDDKNVTWEYHNASNKANYHVSLAHEGYFGVSSSTAWGYTAIESISVTFSGQAKSELWLLTSTDGETWHEQEILVSGQASTKANNWRFIRFYHYDDETTTGNLDVEAVYIDYGCVGISASEDVDNAKVGNVIETSTNLSAYRETVDLSPNSDGGEAVRFTKSGSASTTFVIGFNRTYTFGEIPNAKIEFDIWTTNINYGKTIEVKNTDGSYKSNKFTADKGLHDTNPTNSYVWSSLGNNWYHAELPITALVSFNSGYDTKDVPSPDLGNKGFNAITLNQGNCIIDNLRIGSSACELGNYNSTTWTPVVGEIFWVKTSWVGKLHPSLCSITLSDSSLGRYIPYSDPNLLHESPFYVELLGSGTLTFTVTVTSGYNRVVHTVSNTITIK